MEIDKQKLLALMEAMVSTTYGFESELLLYQAIVQTFCQQHGLGPEKMQELVDRARQKAAPGIAVQLKPGHQALVEKLPQIIELLDSNQDEFLRFLEAWKPKGPVN